MLDETGARALIARQRVRTRVLGVVVVAAMLLNVGIVTLIVAFASRSLVAAAAVSACMVVVAIVTTAVISQPQSRAVYLDADSSRPYVDRIEPVVARVAAALRVGASDVRIADDAALNAFAAGDTVAYTQGLLLALADEELAAVTAQVLSCRTSGEKSLAVFGYGMLAWALEPFDLVVHRRPVDVTTHRTRISLCGRKTKHHKAVPPMTYPIKITKPQTPPTMRRLPTRRTLSASGTPLPRATGCRLINGSSRSAVI